MIEEGVLLINKDKGIPSFHVTKTIRKFTQIKRVGHLGTLDPLAEGLLPILLGKATKLVPFLIRMEKEYVGTMILGEERDTFDSEGKTLNVKVVKNIDPEKIKKTLKAFEGHISQTPPRYSAVKIEGKPSYKWAQSGIKKKLPKREVYIKSIKINKIQGKIISFSLVCSKGTYVRSIVDDFGKKIGFGAYLSALTRTRVGQYTLEKAMKLEKVLQLIEDSRINDKIIGFDQAVTFLPELEVYDEYVESIFNGASCNAEFFKETRDFRKGEIVCLKNSKGNLIGIVSWGDSNPSDKNDNGKLCEYMRVFPQ